MEYIRIERGPMISIGSGTGIEIEVRIELYMGIYK